MSEAFWQTKSLAQMNTAEWESICDGCAKCCLHKLEDEDDGEIYYTRIVCRYLDEENCQCQCYQQRHEKVPECIWLKPDDLDELNWLPASCSYRLLHEGKALPSWHHLVTGSKQTVLAHDASIQGKVVSEEYVHPDGWDEHIVQWVDEILP